MDVTSKALGLVREEIDRLLQQRVVGDFRWTDADVLQYRELCELEKALLDAA